MFTFSATLRFMRSCKVCTHADRSQIEDAILRREPHAKIGERVGVSLYSIYRHSKHLGRSVVCGGDRPLVDRVEALMDRLESISSKAQSAKEWHASVSAMKEVRCSLELLAKLTGQMPVGQSMSVGVALNVSTIHSTSSLSDVDLEARIALDVAEATNNFDPATIARLQRLAMRNRPALLMDTAMENNAS